MLKHNKKRNTAFLYEVLIREVTKLSVEKDKNYRDRVISILKHSFHKNTEMGKELRLFKDLLETRAMSARAADKLIQETKQEYEMLDTKKIFEEQSSLIGLVNKEFSKEVFSNFVPNYKDIATLSQIFGKSVTTKKRVILEEKVLNKMTSENGAATAKGTPLSGLVVKKFVERFNNKYSTSLLENQKKLLNKFILSFLDSGADFKVYLNEELHSLKEKIGTSFDLPELKEDEGLSLKMKKVKELLEQSHTIPTDRAFLEQVLKIQTLASEIDS